jgi:hypothetical protein
MIDFKIGDTIATFSDESPNYPVKGFFINKSIWGDFEILISNLLIDNNGKSHTILTGIDYPDTRLHNIRMVLVEKNIMGVDFHS